MAISDTSPNLDVRRGRKTLSFAALGSLEPLEAAAYFVVRRSEGLTDGERDVLQDWLAVHADHGEALTQAEYIWRTFDAPVDHEILMAMRARALAPRPRMGANWRLVVATAVLASVVSIGWLAMRRGDRLHSRR